MLTGAIVGLVVGLIGAMVVMAKQSKAKARMKADLLAKGVPMQPGLGAMQMRQNLLMQNGARTPEWSAFLPGQPNVNIYQTGPFVVAGWTSASGKPGTAVMGLGPGANPDKKKLTEIPKKQLPVKGLRLYVDQGGSQWAPRSQILQAFGQRFSKEIAWQFVYTDGNAYLWSYQAGFAGVDDAIRTVGQFEQALHS